MNSNILDAAVRSVVRRMGFVDARDLYDLARGGNRLARQYWHTEVLHAYRMLS